MKCFTVSIALVVMCAFLVAAQTTPTRKFKHSGKIVTKYDKSKNLTTVVLQSYTITNSASGPMDYVNGVDLLAGFTYEGDKPTGNPQAIEFALDVTRTRQRDDKLNIPDLIAEIDGEQVNLGKPKRIEATRSDFKAYNQQFSSLDEKIAVLLSKDVFQKITSAKKVKLQSGDVKVTLGEKHLEALRDLASRIE